MGPLSATRRGRQNGGDERGIRHLTTLGGVELHMNDPEVFFFLAPSAIPRMAHYLPQKCLPAGAKKSAVNFQSNAAKV